MDSMTVDATYPGTQAVTRAISLLKSFSDSQPEWNLHELAEANGLNRSTTYRLLAALENEGFVTRQPESRIYRLGPELIALGGCALRSSDLRSVARPTVQALAETTGESATLEVMAGDQVIVIDETSGQHVVGMSQDVGSRLPVHATSTGKVLLAYAEAETVQSVLDGPLPALTEYTVTASEELRDTLQQVRERGYAVTSGELEIGFVAIAAPVFNHEGKAIAAISVGGPSARLPADRLDWLADQVMLAGRRVSSQLGFRND